jgi:sporulation protein YlmC with PRC-barrel domain
VNKVTFASSNKNNRARDGVMYITEIIGKMVLDKNANSVGKVVDANIAFPEWKVKHLLVKTGAFNKLNIEIGKVDKLDNNVILNVDKDELIKVMI